jgi:tRNA(Ile)-lysidine synthetase-like protein
MVLLDLMACAAVERGYELIVAHFDHGLRPDSAADRALVASAAAGHGLKFVYHEAHLMSASEAASRSARLSWLERVRDEHHAAAVVTAHHEDDLIETSLLNLARGSGRRGLAPMPPGPLVRPLLGLARTDLRAYATAHGLRWHEDSTNADLSNPRNFLRHRLLSAAPAAWRTAYLAKLRRLAALNAHLSGRLEQILAAHHLESNHYSFPRPVIRDLSLPELEELLLAAALAFDPAAEPAARTVRELALFAKIAPPHRFRDLRVQGLRVAITPQAVSLVSPLSHTKSSS